MPLHDVSDAFDPTFFDDYTVRRRTETINSLGRVVMAVQSYNTIGVVTPSSPNDLNRLPEQQYMNKAITIYTQFKIQGPAPGFQPDEIVWHGSRYIVTAVDDYAGYGRGFIMVICVSMDAVDPAPPLPE
jgi:hypothetical protein